MSLLDNLVTAVFKPTRQIGPYSSAGAAGASGPVSPLIPFSAQVTIKELHTDELCITEHPVERGAAITDHAFKKPCELMLALGWSNSGLQSALSFLSGVAADNGQGTDFSFMQAMYKKLLQLQEARIPFDITTGKRKYTNMLIRTLTVPTEDTTEHSLFITMILRQVLIVQTQAVSSTPAEVQKTPQSNAPINDYGTLQAIPKNLNPNDIVSIRTVIGPEFTP